MEKITNNSFSTDHLYVVTSVFNPAGYKKRYDLYYQFEEHMKKFGIKLITIECVYGDSQDYSVTESKNPYHIQVRTTDPLWHKENLLNMAIRKLPEDWESVLWLDAD